jgi:non-heme Fe2+,alpha-ketoglutarate-dependent halogenase
VSALDPGRVADYRRQGYLCPIPVLDPPEVERYRAAVDELEARLGGSPRPSDMSQPQLHFRWAYELATHPRVLDAVEAVLGPDLLVHSASIFSKPPRSRSFVSWHQDGAYWDLSEPGVTSAWIALSPSTPENGCLRVVPGSHTRRTLPFSESPAPDNLLASGAEIAVEVDESEARDIVLAPGEMSLHHVDIVHGSNPNGSDVKRVGFAVRYIAPGVSQRLAHHDVLLARGHDRHGHYTLREHPPTAGIEEGLAAQAEFSDRWRRFRLGR